MVSTDKQRYSKPSASDLLFRKQKKKHSLPQTLKADLNKFLKKNEEMDFRFSVVGGSYYKIRTNQRKFYVKKAESKFSFLYDVEDLIKDYESGNSIGFKNLSSDDPSIYLHLAIAYWRENRDMNKCLQALEMFIKTNPDARGRNVLKITEDCAWLFELSIEGYALLAKGYLEIGMLEEASMVYSIYAKNQIEDEEREAFLGYTYLLLGQYKKASLSFDEDIRRYKHLDPTLLHYYKYHYFWALGMERWEDNDKKSAVEAFLTAKKMAEKNGAQERLMSYLTDLIDTGKDIENMPSQFLLLNKWRKEAGEKIDEPKESDTMQIILQEVRLLQRKVESIEGKRPIQGKGEEQAHEEERLKTEPFKYLVFIPYGNKIGTRSLEVSERVIKKKYLPESKEFDIFIYTESIFIRNKKEMIRLQLDARMRKLLIIFLRYKDKMIDPIPLYRKAWADAPERQMRIELDSDVTPYLKVAKSQLESKIYKYVPNFRVEKPRNQGYICKGLFNFCVIINSKDDKKYRLIEVSNTEDYS